MICPEKKNAPIKVSNSPQPRPENAHGFARACRFVWRNRLSRAAKERTDRRVCRAVVKESRSVACYYDLRCRFGLAFPSDDDLVRSLRQDCGQLCVDLSRRN